SFCVLILALPEDSNSIFLCVYKSAGIINKFVFFAPFFRLLICSCRSVFDAEYVMFLWLFSWPATHPSSSMICTIAWLSSKLCFVRKKIAAYMPINSMGTKNVISKKDFFFTRLKYSRLMINSILFIMGKLIGGRFGNVGYKNVVHRWDNFFYLLYLYLRDKI